MTIIRRASVRGGFPSSRPLKPWASWQVARRTTTAACFVAVALAAVVVPSSQVTVTSHGMSLCATRYSGHPCRDREQRYTVHPNLGVWQRSKKDRRCARGKPGYLWRRFLFIDGYLVRSLGAQATTIPSRWRCSLCSPDRCLYRYVEVPGTACCTCLARCFVVLPPGLLFRLSTFHLSFTSTLRQGPERELVDPF